MADQSNNKRPGWLPPGWLHLHQQDIKRPLYLHHTAIASVHGCDSEHALLLLHNGKSLIVNEDPGQVFIELSAVTR